MSRGNGHHRRVWARRKHLIAIPIGLGLVLAGAGCQTERIYTSDGRPMPPRPRAVPAAPVGVVPNRMSLLVGSKPEDADGNGYPDRVPIETALFCYPEHTSAISSRGAFVFTLFRQGDAGQADAAPLREWRFDDEVAQQSRSRSAYGVCYRFQLSLLDGGSDRLPAIAGDLRGRFEPADGGAPVHASNEVRPVQIGRSMVGER